LSQVQLSSSLLPHLQRALAIAVCLSYRPTMADNGAESTTTTTKTGTVQSSSPSNDTAVSGTTNETALQELLERTGYPLVQDNGQRKYGPPPNWPSDQPPPARGCEVFVGKIPRDCFEVQMITSTSPHLLLSIDIDNSRVCRVAQSIQQQRCALPTFFL